LTSLGNLEIGVRGATGAFRVTLEAGAKDAFFKEE
jgi:hypothetical protein